MKSVNIYLIILLFFINGLYGYPASLVEQILGNEDLDIRDNSVGIFEDEFNELDIYLTKNLTNSTKMSNYTNNIIPFTTEFSEQKSEIRPSNKTYSIKSIIESTKKRLNNTNSSSAKREPVNSFEEKESQEEASSEEEGNMVTGLLSAFLSGFSKADGSIDLEAILGLLGSLSTQNADGTYDFSGLTELLQSFFGGGDDGGGSDIGAFVGSLTGALIKGVANPPGAKGAGILSGKVLTGVFPALSGPAPKDENDTSGKEPPAIDSGGFLTGFLKTVLGSSSGGNGTGQGSPASKFMFFKLLVSTITGLVSSASSLSSKSDWND